MSEVVSDQDREDALLVVSEEPVTYEEILAKLDGVFGRHDYGITACRKTDDASDVTNIIVDNEEIMSYLWTSENGKNGNLDLELCTMRPHVVPPPAPGLVRDEREQIDLIKLKTEQLEDRFDFFEGKVEGVLQKVQTDITRISVLPNPDLTQIQEEMQVILSDMKDTLQELKRDTCDSSVNRSQSKRRKLDKAAQLNTQ